MSITPPALDLTPSAEPAGILKPASEPGHPRRHTLRTIFFGTEGLRAGWGLLLFLVLLVGISFTLQFAIAKIEHKPFGRAAQKAAQKTAQAKSTANSAAQPKPDTAAEQTPPRTMLKAEGLSFAVVLLITFLVSRVERRPVTTYGLGGRHRLKQFFQGLAWGALCLSLLIGLLRAGGFLHFDARLLATPAALRFGLLWTLGFTLVALLEETLLRGYVQYTLARGLAAIVGTISETPHRRAIGFWAGAIILSFVFGLGHSSNAGESPIGLLSAGLAGLVFCLALYRTGSLWWAIGFHAAWDWAQSFLYGVADSGTMVQGHLFATHPIGRPILSGGLTGPEGSILILPVLAIAAAIILLTLPQHPHPAPYLTVNPPPAS